MKSTFSPHFSNFEETPKVIKNLLFIICVATLLAAIIDPFLLYYGIPPLKQLFALSHQGAVHYFLWQPLTYVFLQPTQSVHLSFLFNLIIQMYILWLFSTAIVERFGKNSFLRLYFFTAIVSGLSILCYLFIAHSSAYVLGFTPVLFALFTVWTMLHSESRILLFFFFPVQAKWLFAAAVGGMILISFSQADSISLLQITVGTLLGYLYGTLGWQLQSPYPFMHSLDIALADVGLFIRAKWEQLFGSHSDKIIDIRTGKSIDRDDVFVDAMLEKISKHGKHSLSWFERRRLDKISRKRPL